MNTTHDWNDGGNPAPSELQLPRASSSTWRTIFVIGLVALAFLIGATGGIALGRRTAYAGFPRFDQIAERVANRMRRELNLTTEQRDEIIAIIRGHQPEFRRIRAQIAPELRAELRSTIAEMATVLTPEQAETWREQAERRLDEHFAGLPQD